MGGCGWVGGVGGGESVVCLEPKPPMDSQRHVVNPAQIIGSRAGAKAVEEERQVGVESLLITSHLVTFGAR
jgi:hypothetical protein